nr:GAF domain-containing protein [Tanacetum cinerariifolium]
MYYHFLRPRLGLYYGMRPLIIDADALELPKNLTKEWKEVSSNKALSIETDDHFDDLEERLGDYANTRTEIIVHVGNSSIVENVVDCDILYKTEGVCSMGNFKEVEVDVDNEIEEESAKSDKKE